MAENDDEQLDLGERFERFDGTKSDEALAAMLRAGEEAKKAFEEQEKKPPLEYAHIIKPKGWGGWEVVLKAIAAAISRKTCPYGREQPSECSDFRPCCGCILDRRGR